MSTVNVEINSKWVKRAHSPLYRVVATVQGVAISFAPWFLFEAGQGRFHKYDYPVAAACAAMIVLVGSFYVHLGNEVIRELRGGIIGIGSLVAPSELGHKGPGTVREIMNYPMGYSYPCPTIHVNTAVVHNSSAVSLSLLLVVVATYIPASSAKRKRKRKAFSNGPKGRKERAFLLTCAPPAAL